MEAITVTQGFLDLHYAHNWYQLCDTDVAREKTPIIFIHGGPGFSSEYIINLHKIAHVRPCIFYDQSGCGKSYTNAAHTIEWTLEHYVQEISTIIEMLGYKTVILFGFSWGAAIAVQYAVQHQHKIEKLILASPYLSTPHLVENYKERARSIGIYDIMCKYEEADTMDSQEYQDAYKKFFSNFIFRGNPDLLKGYSFNKTISDGMWGQKELTATGNLKDMNLIPLLHTIRIPTLLTSGFWDTMTSAYMQLIHAELRCSAHVLFQQSAHMSHLEEEDMYMETVSKFVM